MDIELRNRKCLVTGGSGFIGGALVKRLVKEGCRVRVLDNQSRGTPEHLKEVEDKIELVIGDIRDPKAVAQACQGMESVFHLAFINGTEFFYTKPDEVLDVGVKGMVNVLDASIQAQVKDFILASSSEVYQTPPCVPTDETAPLCIPDPLNPRYSYGAGKMISEIMAINYGRKYFERVLIFRPHNVYGPNMGWEHVIPQFVVRMKDVTSRSGGGAVDFPIQGTGNETRAFCYIDDFIDGIMAMYTKGEHLNIYHVGNDEEVTVLDLAQRIGKHFKRSVKVLPGQEAKGSTSRRCPDISKLRKLGYRPHVTLEEGLGLTIPWYVEHAEQRMIKR